jgi:hypothetical protein
MPELFGLLTCDWAGFCVCLLSGCSWVSRSRPAGWTRPPRGVSAQLGKAGFDEAMLAALAEGRGGPGAKAAKRHQAVSGYWHSLATLGRWCRLRSYLDTAAAHGITALDAVAGALAGNPGYHHSLPSSDTSSGTP